jgi:hypothetical protein
MATRKLKLPQIKKKKLLMQRNNRKQAMSVFPALCIEGKKSKIYE